MSLCKYDSSEKPVEVGQSVYFDPFAFICNFYGRNDMLGKPVCGTVVFINQAHRWFSVAYHGLRTSFHFSDIGENVKLGRMNGSSSVEKSGKKQADHGGKDQSKIPKPGWQPL